MVFTGTSEYDAALAKYRIASGKFIAVRSDYRKRVIGDDAYLAARKEFDAAQAELDKAELTFIAANKTPLVKSDKKHIYLDLDEYQ